MLNFRIIPQRSLLLLIAGLAALGLVQAQEFSDDQFRKYEAEWMEVVAGMRQQQPATVWLYEQVADAGRFYAYAGKAGLAELYLQEAMRESTRLQNFEPAQAERVFLKAAQAYCYLGDLEKQESALRMRLKLLQAADTDSRKTANAAYHLARLFDRQQRFDRAERNYKAAVALAREDLQGANELAKSMSKQALDVDGAVGIVNQSMAKSQLYAIERDYLKMRQSRDSQREADSDRAFQVALKSTDSVCRE